MAIKIFHFRMVRKKFHFKIVIVEKFGEKVFDANSPTAINSIFIYWRHRATVIWDASKITLP